MSEVYEKQFNQSQPLRIECCEFSVFNTTRCRESRLWFIDMPQELEDRILGYLAYYAQKYSVKVYGAAFMGNHYHLLVHFTQPNRAHFQRDFNARIAEGVKMFVKEYGSGSLFERRYSSEVVPRDLDVLDRFYYCALQAVRAGLTEDPFKHPQYNSFHDAATGTPLTRPVVAWGKYHAAKRKSPQVDRERYTTWYTLHYTRLPGCEEMTQEEYKDYLFQELERRRVEEVELRKAQNKGFLRENTVLLRGSKPKTTKKSTRTSKRPLVLTGCDETRTHYLTWHLNTYYEYKEASAKYLQGDLSVTFPPGTYRPPLIMLSEPNPWGGS